MPRKSVESLTVFRASAEHWASPPPALPESVHKLWWQILMAHPAGHFGPGDLALVEQFCRTQLLLDRLNAALDGADLIVGDKVHPALRELANAVRTLSTLAQKLRICASARLRSDSASLRPGDSTELEMIEVLV